VPGGSDATSTPAPSACSSGPTCSATSSRGRPTGGDGRQAALGEQGLEERGAQRHACRGDARAVDPQLHRRSARQRADAPREERQRRLGQCQPFSAVPSIAQSSVAAAAGALCSRRRAMAARNPRRCAASIAALIAGSPRGATPPACRR
jgi:hypothetical protein